ncbi:MAG: hypothetical protein MJZ79_02555 [Paludibacteraceae bacterium]|nr:hypothetical protein [Paludibacteraceae bacterium]
MIGQIFNAQELTQKLKATIQRTGKLGFTAETIDTLKLKGAPAYVRIAPDTEDKNLYYMAVVREEVSDGFKVCHSGDYVFLQTKQLFDKINLDYAKWNIMFDLARFEEGDTFLGGECYTMALRKKERLSEDK